MITCIQCPVCDSNLKLDVAAKIRTKLRRASGDRLIEKRELVCINIRKIEPMERKWLAIIERIQPYIRPGLTTDELTKILNEEYNICIAHTPALVEKIKEAYNLYAKDGKTLEKI